MQHALFPFSSIKNAGGADLRERLHSRKAGKLRTTPGIDNLELLDTLVPLLRELPWQIRIDDCHEADGDLRLAVVALDLGRDIQKGDRVQAGFYLANSEEARFDTLACERVYRVACENGALVECEAEQSMVVPASMRGSDWKGTLPKVIARCFSAEGMDRDAARFRATCDQMIVTPYEFLCNLEAQRIISEDEQNAIHEAFAKAGDSTMYGLVNAVTQVAHRLRERDDWMRALEIERLGGEIVRGDHQPPVLEPAYV